MQRGDDQNIKETKQEVDDQHKKKVNEFIKMVLSSKKFGENNMVNFF